MNLAASLPIPSDSPASPAAAARGLLHDYNLKASVYWWLLLATGALALGHAVWAVSQLPAPAIWQTLAGAAIAAVVGLFPLRIPGSKNSIAAGDIFIFLLLLLFGPAAAVVAATAEAAACAWKTSRRASSRLAGPAAAAVAMLACGSLFTGLVTTLAGAGYTGDGTVFGATLVFAGLYFVVSPNLVTTVIYLKRSRAPTAREWLSSFGWLGLGYAASASIAGVLFIAFRQFGLTSVLVSVPMIAMFVATLRFYFAQQEASERSAAERASRDRAENAEREARMSAQHLHALALSDRRFQSAFSHAAIGMALASHDGRLVQVNPAMGGLLGREDASLIGEPFTTCIDASDHARLDRLLHKVKSGRADHFQAVLRCVHAQGREVWASIHGSYFAPDAGSDSLLIFQAFDITAQRQAEGRLHHLAFHDSLTDLANRSLLDQSVGLAIEAHRDEPLNQFSLMHLSFDRFRLLSDSFGHGVGDQFLVAVARRIRELVRPGDLLARLEGDDFGVLALHRGSGTHHAIALAERLQQAFVAPVMINDTEVHAGASIGITFSDIEYASADEVLRDAKLAMAKARASGKSRYALFDASLHERASEQLLLEGELRRAIDAGQLVLAYQPVFAINPLRLVGFEALARWPHATRGMISPASFIPVAEESGLIVKITQWALDQACRQLQVWRDQQGAAASLFVNVNIAGQDLCDPAFADKVLSVLDKHELPPRCLTLEITETTLMQQLEIGSRTLSRLREIGVGLSVDDFGTGYSSLSHLSSLPINSLKIDRSFVSRLDGASADTEIVRAVIQLGHALGKRVIAEGIETTAQLERLRELGCGYAQGFLLSRPLAAAQATALVESALADAPPPPASRRMALYAHPSSEDCVEV